jgi:branched-chain amino acid transport system substrate-binding protein
MAQLEAFREMTGGKCDYITTLIDVSCLDNPIGRPFYRAYMEKYGESPIYIAPGTYLAVWAVAMAIEEAGTVDPDKIVEALERIDEWRDKLYEAMLYESAHVLRFDKSHDVVWGVYDPTKGFIAAFMQWQEGERKTVWPEAAKVADFMIPPHLKPASP